MKFLTLFGIANGVHVLKGLRDMYTQYGDELTVSINKNTVN